MRTEAEIRISQCMIVKNEEKNIERALSWGKKIMWEQVVVDTGSVDHTIEIARHMGAIVFEFPWEDDFAAAKNYAIQQCKGDWIALLDADEYMVSEDVKKLPEIIRELEKRKLDGLSTGWQQVDDEGKIFSSGTQVRFFRNDKDIRYRRRIHEQLVSITGRELRLGDKVKEISIFHTGYQTGILRAKTKNGRNRKLILEELKDNPDDYEMMGYMGDECLADHDNAEAEQWYLRSIKHMPSQLRQNDQRSAVTFTRLLMLLSEKEGSLQGDVEKIYNKAVRLLPMEADFDYMMGRFLAILGQEEQAVFYLESALNKLDSYGCNNRALVLAGNLLEAYDLLTRCCYEAGWREKCASYAVIYLKYNKYDMAVLSRLLKTLLVEEDGTSESQTVLDFLSKLYDFSRLKDKMFVVKAAEMSERIHFADFAAGRLLTGEERALLGI